MFRTVTYHLAYLLQTLKWHVFLLRHFFLCEIYMFSIIIIDFISSLFLQSMRKYIQPRQVNVHLRDWPKHWNKFSRKCLESSQKRKDEVCGQGELGDDTDCLNNTVYGQGCDSYTIRGQNIISLGFQLQLNKDILVA